MRQAGLPYSGTPNSRKNVRQLPGKVTIATNRPGAAKRRLQTAADPEA